MKGSVLELLAARILFSPRPFTQAEWDLLAAEGCLTDRHEVRRGALAEARQEVVRGLQNLVRDPMEWSDVEGIRRREASAPLSLVLEAHREDLLARLVQPMPQAQPLHVRTVDGEVLQALPAWSVPTVGDVWIQPEYTDRYREHRPEQRYVVVAREWKPLDMTHAVVLVVKALMNESLGG